MVYPAFLPNRLLAYAKADPEARARFREIAAAIKGDGQTLGAWRYHHALLLGPETAEGKRLLDAAYRNYRAFYAKRAGGQDDVLYQRVLELKGVDPSPARVVVITADNCGVARSSVGTADRRPDACRDKGAAATSRPSSRSTASRLQRS